MSFMFSNVLVVILLFILADVSENKTFIIETVDEGTDGNTLEHLTEKEMGQDYSDDIDFALDAAPRFNPVIHKRNDLRNGKDGGSFWNREGSGFEPEIVTEDHFPKKSTVESSTKAEEKEEDYHIPIDFLKMLTKPAE